MKAQIEINQLNPIPDHHYVLTPIGSGASTEWKELSADDRHQFYLADCGGDTLLYRIQPNGISFIDTKSKLVERIVCPKCRHPMHPKVYHDGWLDQSEYVCECGMIVELEYN